MWPDEDIDVASLLVPVDVANTAGVLQSITENGSALPEDPNPAWNSSANYNTLGFRVHSPVTHRVYENLKTDGSNTGKDPTLAVNRTTAAGVGTYWFDVGPTNKYAAFDGRVNTQLSAASPLTIVLTPGAFNQFALLGIDADTIAWTVRDAHGGTVIASLPTTPLEGSMPGDYYEYFFDPFKPQTRYVASDLEPYSSSEITLTLTKGTGPVKLGMFAIGDARPIGIPSRDAVVTPADYSLIETNAYGETTIRKRPFATGMTITTHLEIGEANVVLDTIQQVLGTPVLLIGSKAALYEWMTCFGLVSAQLSAPDHGFAKLSITQKGLI